MEPKYHTRRPCSLRGHNAQAQQIAPVTVARARVFPTGAGNGCGGLRSTLLRPHRRSIMTLRGAPRAITTWRTPDKMAGFAQHVECLETIRVSPSLAGSARFSSARRLALLH
jgi:hypothetical protein